MVVKALSCPSKNNGNNPIGLTVMKGQNISRRSLKLYALPLSRADFRRQSCCTVTVGCCLLHLRRHLSGPMTVCLIVIYSVLRDISHILNLSMLIGIKCVRECVCLTICVVR